jgi:hypothetical protein
MPVMPSGGCLFCVSIAPPGGRDCCAHRADVQRKRGTVVIFSNTSVASARDPSRSSILQRVGFAHEYDSTNSV